MKLNEFDIYQNSSLGAILLYEFVNSYEKTEKENRSPSLGIILAVLPILFTKDITDSAKGRSSSLKGLYNLIEDNKLLFELTSRKIDTSFENTMTSLLIAHKSNMLDVDFSKNSISSVRMPFKKYTPSSIKIGELIRTARKFGGWFSKLSDIEFLVYLNITY